MERKAVEGRIPNTVSMVEAGKAGVETRQQIPGHSRGGGVEQWNL
ncbi:MAG TPA: hypothetical protein PLQ57_03500 [Saprospiraceae bacterium]|nr:hypothetical protein [Saprospiraceae bacterium]